MARKIYPYSLDRKDAKIAGVCSTIGSDDRDRPDLRPHRLRRRRDPHQLQADRCIAYAALGIYLALQKKQAMSGERRMSDFDRMDEVVAAASRPCTRCAPTSTRPTAG